MTRSRATALIVLTLTASGAAVGALSSPAPRLDVVLEPAAVTVGDPVRATLSVELPASNPPPRFPRWTETWGTAEIAAVSEPVASPVAGGLRWEQRIDLRVFQPGEVVLPPPDVRLPGGSEPLPVHTDELRLRVRSVLPDGVENPEPMPPAEPLELPAGRRFWITAASAATLLGLLLLALSRRSREVPSETSAPPVPPIERFRSELGIALSQNGEPAWTTLSVALRRYLGARLGFPALESTTTEIRRRLGAASEPAVTGQSRAVVRLLAEADGVRFARRPASGRDLRQALESARALIEGIEAALHAAEVARATAREEAA